MKTPSSHAFFLLCIRTIWWSLNSKEKNFGRVCDLDPRNDLWLPDYKALRDLVTSSCKSQLGYPVGNVLVQNKATFLQPFSVMLCLNKESLTFPESFTCICPFHLRNDILAIPVFICKTWTGNDRLPSSVGSIPWPVYMECPVDLIIHDFMQFTI